MIVYNEYKEFDKEVREIDREFFYVNLYIYRDDKNTVPYNKYGEIHIPDYGDKTIFCGLLIHEIGHSIYDPITLFNYIKALYEVKKRLDIDDNIVVKLGNLISDIIDDWGIKMNAKLSKYRSEYLKKVFNKWFNPNDRLRCLLWAYYDKIYGCKLKFNKRKYSKYINQIISILNTINDRNKRYVKIAEVLLNFIKNGDSGDSSGEIGDFPVDTPIKVDENEIEKTVQQIYKDADNIEEVEGMLKILANIDKNVESNIRERNKMLKSFYQEKANMIRSFIKYPKTIEQKGIKLGSRKWVLSDGIDKIDAKKTIEKFGVNIPLVTTRTSRVLDRFISSRESSKPIDIVISIDVSGSTEYPNGLMTTVSDYEIIMLYALVDEAKRLDQRVGLTLWSTKIVYTSLPDTYDYRKVDILKDIPLSGYWVCGSTYISHALKQANEYKDKLFLMFTDGWVNYDELIDVNNVMFFLILPRDIDYSKFVEKYGVNRVVRIDNMKDIPKVVINWYRGVFQ